MGAVTGRRCTARRATLRAATAAVACVALVTTLAAGGARATDPLGPAPRDADGRFVNPSGPLSHGSLAVRLPFFLRRAVSSFGSRPGAPERVANDGAFLRENARHSTPAATWIGHATLLVQMGHVTFLTDPIWSERASPVSFAGPPRFVPPGVTLDDLPPVDFVLVSHNHYDHLDLDTLRALAARDPGTRFLVPLGNAALLHDAGIERVEALDWGQRTTHGGVTIHCLPAQHWSQRGLGDRNRALWSSWAVVGDGRRFYFAGDTGMFDGFAAIGRALGPFDLAAVPIGAYEPAAMMRAAHLDPEEAVAAARDLRARRVMAIHYGTFDLSDEPLDEPPRRFRAAGTASGFAAEDVWVVRVGEARAF